MCSLSIVNTRWEEVFTISTGSFLFRGANQMNRELLNRTAIIQNKFGCYCWATNSHVYYCGSFSRDYQNRQSNLEGRVYQYLNNHGHNRRGEPNTNLRVFQNINELLQNEDVKLKILRFDKLLLSDREISYETFSSTPIYVIAVEHLCIATFYSMNQGEWNITG